MSKFKLRLFVSILLLSFFLIFLLSCSHHDTEHKKIKTFSSPTKFTFSPSPQPTKKIQKWIIRPGVSCGPILIGMDVKEANKLLGEPIHKEILKNRITYFYEDNSGISVATTLDGKIDTVMISASRSKIPKYKYVTSSEIKFGDEVDEVLEKLGKPVYQDKKLFIWENGLSMHFKDAKVSTIIIGGTKKQLANPKQETEQKFGIMKWTKKEYISFMNRMLNMVYKNRNFNKMSDNDKTRLVIMDSDIMDWAKKNPEDKDLPYCLYYTAYIMENSFQSGKNRAITLYNFLIANYPKSKYAAEAKTRLRELGY